MHKILAIAVSTFKEAIRNKVMYTAVAFAVVLVAASSLFAAVSLGDQAVVIKDFGLFAMSFGGAAVVMLTGVGLLSRELGRKTIYNILSKPVSRVQFISGKFIGLALTAVFVVGAMGALFLGYCWVIEEKFNFLMLDGVLLVLMEVISVSALVIFFSAMVVTPALAGLFSLGVFLTGKSIEAVRDFINQDPELSYLSSFVVVIEKLVPQSHLYNASGSLVYGEPLGNGYLLEVFLYTLIYSGACILAATGLFYKRELK